MPNNITEFGKNFREKFDYNGKLTKECMGAYLWNEYNKMKSKERNASAEHKKVLSERKELRRQKHIATLKLLKEIGASYERYCKNYQDIENYEKAKVDGFIGWQLHHRLETHTIEGEKRLVDITSTELNALDMYYDRPASELIFMKTIEHRRLHTVGKKKYKKCEKFS